MTSEDLYHLVTAHYEKGWIRLGFAGLNGEACWRTDGSFKPYFYIPYRGSSRTTKIDMFTGEEVELTKIIGESPSTYETKWEEDIDPALSYLYDHNMGFGLPHAIIGQGYRLTLQDPVVSRQALEERLTTTREKDPLKYALLMDFFLRINQPIPEIRLRAFNLSKETDSLERFYRAIMLCRIANIPLEQALTGFSASLCLKSLLHQMMRKMNILIPSNEELKRGETKRSVHGALTLTPESGTYFNMVVTDFESLYPSCIDAFNLSYETVDCSHSICEPNKIPEGFGHVCRRRRGLYSAMVGALRDLRIYWYKPLSRRADIPNEDRILAKTVSDLLKLILVSSYGVTVRIQGLASPKLAESITAYGRFVLQTTWNMAATHGLRPRYGDTDSIFLDNPASDKVQELIKSVKEKWNLDLAVEKKYSFCVLSSAKKAYFGILPDGTPDLKGLALNKSNSPMLFQKVFDICMKELKDIHSEAEFQLSRSRLKGLVQEQQRIIRERKVSLEDLSYRVKLHIEPTAKSRATILPQPYQAAIQLLEQGMELDKYASVEFVKVKPFKHKNRTFTVKPTRQAVLSEVDVDDYVRTLNLALKQVFEPMNIDFGEGSKEPALTQFME